MDTLKVEIELPRDLLIALNIPTTAVKQKTQEWIALELFREGSISSGKAGEMLRLTKSQFIDLLARRKLPYLDLEPDELSQDFGVAFSAGI